MSSIGTKSHRLHSKRAVARKFKRNRACRAHYWYIQALLGSLGYGGANSGGVSVAGATHIIIYRV